MYEQALLSVLLLAMEELLQRQMTQMQTVQEQLHQMASCGEKALIVQLFEQTEVAQQA